MRWIIFQLTFDIMAQGGWGDFENGVVVREMHTAIEALEFTAIL
jgi:hypothetical protein